MLRLIKEVSKTIDTATVDLSLKNPNGGKAVAHRTRKTKSAALDAQGAEVLETVRGRRETRRGRSHCQAWQRMISSVPIPS